MLEMAVDVRDGYVNVLGHFIAIAMWNTIGSTLPAKHDGTFRDRELRMANNSVAFSPKMFLGGLVQYNSAFNTVSTNLRLRWEYSPGSELFVVYTEDRDSTPLRPDRVTELRNRGFVIKFNRLFRF